MTLRSLTNMSTVGSACSLGAPQTVFFAIYELIEDLRGKVMSIITRRSVVSLFSLIINGETCIHGLNIGRGHGPMSASWLSSFAIKASTLSG